MSLAIDPEQVVRVLTGGCWFNVEPGSFDLDSYEFIRQPEYGNDDVLHGGGKSGVCATGFVFKDADNVGRVVFGPLDSIDAVVAAS